MSRSMRTLGTLQKERKEAAEKAGKVDLPNELDSADGMSAKESTEESYVANVTDPREIEHVSVGAFGTESIITVTATQPSEVAAGVENGV
jgi:hypothetical protein